MKKIFGLLFSLAFALVPLQASAAPAFDAVSGGSIPSGNTLTVSHTATGANVVLLVGVTSLNITPGDTVTGVTYNSVAMTQIGKVVLLGTNGETYMYYLALGTGDGVAHDIVVSRSAGSNDMDLEAASYTGASQTGIPDAFSTFSSGASSQTTNSGTLTTIADNSLTIMGSYSFNGGVSAGAATTLRGVEATLGRQALSDSNAPKTPAGSVTLTINASSDVQSNVTASLAPAAATVTTPSRTGTLVLFGDW